jgi:glycosyltransferase involved in cell wall biosynthesis
MTVIPHGLQVPAEMPPRPPAASGKLRVLYLGGISWQKGVHVLVEAANKLPAGIEVMIYGDLKVHAEYAAGLQRRAGANVTLAGRLEHDQIWPALTAADLLVVPSIWYENAPMTILEAKAARTPVVASDLGALPEHVRDGLDGLLFPPGDAAALGRLLMMLYERPERLDQLRLSIGPVRTIEDHVRDVEDVYRSIIH